ncbi:LysR family transcriptional regulator [Ammoniphilus sp. 3BR4]|uniref:LysR family transcriptional regulator n=1 Tax=Ammoniphilus sp. 3BR4 TaxID=3158265 RepID=UPI003466E23B
MNFRHLKYILAVAEEKSFSKAAEKLFIAQPSLSQFIKKVESDLQVNIFDRSKNPIVLTKEGKIFVESAMKILAIYEETKQEIQNLSNGTLNRITIGSTFTLSNILLPDLLNDFKEAAPPIEVTPIESFSKELEELMEKEQIDFSIVSVSSNNYNLHYEPIVSEPFIFAIPRNHSLIENEDVSFLAKNIRIARLNDLPLILPKSGGMRTVLDRYFTKNNIEPNIVMESQSLDTILSLVSAGLGISIVPKMLIGSVGKWKSFKIDYAFFKDNPPTITLGIVYKKNITLSPLVERSIQITKRNLLKKFAVIEKESYYTNSVSHTEGMDNP